MTGIGLFGGGALYVNGRLAGGIYDSEFINNRSAHEGGAIKVRTFDGDLRNTVFQGNMANASGGAIWVDNIATGWIGGIHDSVFTNNVAATRYAGAIDSAFITDGIHNTRFVGNRSVLGGGAIAAGATGAINQSVFVDNTSTGGAALTQDAGVGGALSLDDNVTLIDSIFLRNAASSLNPNGFDSGWGGVLLHHDASNNTGATITVSARSGEQTLFYGNTHNPANTGETPNAIHFGNYNAANNNLQTTLNIQGAGRVLMLDALSSQADGLMRQSGTPYGNLTTFVNKTGTGEWYLGSQSQMQGASTWSINDGVLRLVTTDYGGSIGVLPAQINLAHTGTAQFTLGVNATLAGSGTISARDVLLSGTIRPNTWVNTGTLAPDLVVQTNAIIASVTAAVMADATIPATNKLFVINNQARQQIANLVDVAQDTSTFGTLTFNDTAGGSGVTMQGATIDIGLSYVNGNSVPGDLIKVSGATGVLNVLGNNTINITGLTYTGTIPPDDTGINAGNLATFANIIETTGGIVGNPFNLTIAGQPVAQVDFADAFGGVVGTDYKLGVGLSWYSTRKNGSMIDQAHGDFTLAAGSQFTLNGNLTTRTNTDGINWDGNSLTKKGDGTLILNGVNTYTGLTSITAGELVLGDATHATAQINGNVTANGTLSGFGTARGVVTMQAGSTLAPGSATTIAPLTVGQLQLNPGSTLAVKLHENGTSDLVNVTALGAGNGTADLNGANLLIRNGGSTIPINWNQDATYTIVTTQNGVSGSFGAVTNTLAFLDPFVIYNPNTVQLRMVRNNTPFEDICQTTNQCEVGGEIGKLPPGDPIPGQIVGLTPEQGRDAYDNLSGEIYGSTRSAILDDRQLRDAVNRRMKAHSPEGKQLWIDAWGHSGHVKGNANAAKVNVAGMGLALGADHAFTPNLTAGAFFGYEDNRISNGSTRNSRSDVEGYSAGVYAAGKAGNFELRGGVAYSRLDVETRRDIAVGSLQGRVKSDSKAHKVQAFIEASRPFAVNDRTTISPYLNVAQVWLRANDTTETGNAAALEIASQTDNVQVSTLGVRTSISLPTQTPIKLTADLGWAHAFGDTDGKTSNRFAGRGARFEIAGTSVDKNQALIGAGVQAQLTPNASLHVDYQGQFGSNTNSHTGQVQVRVRF